MEFMAASDRVLVHSMQTLIHRTASTDSTSSISFTDKCIASAREALAYHQSCPVVLADVQSSFLSSYMSWFIFLRPFTPFIVLFCHVVETGDRDDLLRLQQFVHSMQHSDTDAARKHQRLFQVFYNVALRYTELKTRRPPALTSSSGEQSHEDQSELDLGYEIDNCLTAMGLNAHASGLVEVDSSRSGITAFASESSGLGEVQINALTEVLDADAAPTTSSPAHLPYWFQVSQQMMELMDSSQMSF